MRADFGWAPSQHISVMSAPVVGRGSFWASSPQLAAQPLVSRSKVEVVEVVEVLVARS